MTAFGGLWDPGVTRYLSLLEAPRPRHSRWSRPGSRALCESAVFLKGGDLRCLGFRESVLF